MLCSYQRGEMGGVCGDASPQTPPKHLDIGENSFKIRLYALALLGRVFYRWKSILSW